MTTINSFTGEYFFLSNFLEGHPITYREQLWPTTEHLYQALKTNDKDEREKIRLVGTPAASKKMGRTLTLRPDWEDVKELLMYKVCSLKFKQYPNLKQLLLDTGTAVLIEGNTWHDNIWGDCTCSKCENILGQNLLGKTLTRIRQELKVDDFMDKVSALPPTKRDMPVRSGSVAIGMPVVYIDGTGSQFPATVMEVTSQAPEDAVLMLQVQRYSIDEADGYNNWRRSFSAWQDLHEDVHKTSNIDTEGWAWPGELA